jgi:RimJ/RimL family protein N-acetyltransferase
LEPISLKYCTESYVNWLNDPDVYKYLETRGNQNIQKLRIFLTNITKADCFFWAITLKDNNKHIGNIKIDFVNKVHSIAEYGILMGDKSEWGKGYAYEASKIVIKYLFKENLIRKITLGVLSENVNAINLYNKIGFIQEGLYKKHLIYDGKEYDVLRMALFNQK